METKIPANFGLDVKGLCLVQQCTCATGCSDVLRIESDESAEVRVVTKYVFHPSV